MAVRFRAVVIAVAVLAAVVGCGGGGGSDSGELSADEVQANLEEAGYQVDPQASSAAAVEDAGVENATFLSVEGGEISEEAVDPGVYVFETPEDAEAVLEEFDSEEAEFAEVRENRLYRIAVFAGETPSEEDVQSLVAAGEGE
jgi:hypothetical protein